MKHICEGCQKEFVSQKSKLAHGSWCKDKTKYTLSKIEEHDDEILELYDEGAGIYTICNIIEKKYKIRLPGTKVKNFIIAEGREYRTIGKCHTKFTKDRYKATCEKKYGKGITNAGMTVESRNKAKATTKKIYGVDNVAKSEYYKAVMYIMGRTAKDTKEYKKYQKAVEKLTKKRKNKEQLINEKWTGKCYYTDIEIYDESSGKHFNNMKFKTIDHKNSVMWCYNKGWSIEQAASIDNLCFCSRICNTVKREMTEEEFLVSDTYERLLFYESEKGNKPKRKVFGM
jgi:hypothetical protein